MGDEDGVGFAYPQQEIDVFLNLRAVDGRIVGHNVFKAVVGRICAAIRLDRLEPDAGAAQILRVVLRIKKNGK